VKKSRQFILIFILNDTLMPCSNSIDRQPVSSVIYAQPPICM